MERSVVHINTADNLGGAARGVFRIHRGLIDQGWASRMLVRDRSIADSAEIDQCPPRSRLRHRLAWRTCEALENFTAHEYCYLPGQKNFLAHPFSQKASVFHLHNVHGRFFSLGVLPDLASRGPIVWTLHDLWPVTGHCYYPTIFDCERYRHGCGDCPGLADANYFPLRRDTTRHLFSRKKRLYGRADITFVALTESTARMARQSPLAADQDVRVIPYGQDTKRFQPVSKEHARRFLGLPTDSPVIMIIALALQIERKGWRYLEEALHLVQQAEPRPLTLLCVGGEPVGHRLQETYQVKDLGFVNDDWILNLAYNAADVVATGSIGELFGNLFLEAMSCGTPVVAFDKEAVNEVARHMETGFLARPRDSSEMAKGLRLLITDDDLRNRMAGNARELAIAEYSMDRQANLYGRLYEELLERG